jgi:hypothetical protein
MPDATRRRIDCAGRNGRMTVPLRFAAILPGLRVNELA